MIQQRQREAQILALRREGVLLEEEYREEIRYYMHDMEVSALVNISDAANVTQLNTLVPHRSGSQCLPPSLWINNLR